VLRIEIENLACKQLGRWDDKESKQPALRTPANLRK
jgi:hypothetical protein